MPSGYKTVENFLRRAKYQDQNHYLDNVTDTTAAPKPDRDGVWGQKGRAEAEKLCLHFPINL